MAWIKRNLYFVIGGLVALGLMGYGGFLFWSAYSSESASAEQIISQYGVLDELNKQNPNPGSAGAGKVDNVKTAKEQEQALRAFLNKSRALFLAPTPLPAGEIVDDQKFSNQLLYTIAELNRGAKAASVTLPESYAFTFQSQKFLTQFDPGSVPLLAMHLGNIKAICDVLFAARINALDVVQREVVSAKDQNSADYLTSHKTIGTAMGDLTPYRVVFRCFSAELADVLSGLASSPYCFIVKTINIEPAAALGADQASPSTVAAATPAPEMSRTMMMNQMMAGGGMQPGGGGMTPASRYMNRMNGGAPAPMPVAAPPPAPKPTVLLNERQLKVNLLIEVVKLKSTNEVAKPKAPAAGAGRSRTPAAAATPQP